ncbi:hypothetical protein MPL1032_270117 [Mesorhizobium plurifarium]|uniref:ABC transporter domain-containing protein n=1 Tax=Mesorhizobium plurifarium TaxID=69974 RepID=A0A0K2W229_MESPL|nr:hypothetical protein MPL1032_270117 [Mesorhizobium plurifarium]
MGLGARQPAGSGEEDGRRLSGNGSRLGGKDRQPGAEALLRRRDRQGRLGYVRSSLDRGATGAARQGRPVSERSPGSQGCLHHQDPGAFGRRPAQARRARRVMPSAIEARRLDVGYGGRQTAVKVLAGLDLTVAAGSFLSILGPSGCGKSTCSAWWPTCSIRLEVRSACLAKHRTRCARAAMSASSSRIRPCCPGARCAIMCACRSVSARAA